MKPAARHPLARFANLGLSLGVSVLFLGVMEGGARLYERRQPPPAVEDYIWDWDKKWDGDFYTIRSDANGWPPWEEFNADGLRDRTHAVEKPAGVSRVAFLGDSVTLGAGIEPAEAFPQVVQARLDDEGRRLEVFNVALWGWSTRQQRIAYERLARKYRPEAVVLGVCLNDVAELQNNLSRPPRALTALHERSALVRVLINAPGREIQSVEQLFEQPEPPKVREAWERFFAEVHELRLEVEADGAAFALLVFPFRFQVMPGAPAPRAQARIAEFCAAKGLRCLDLLPELSGLGAGAFVDYDHLSPQGARRVAEVVLASGLLPSPPAPRDRLLERFARDGSRAQAAVAAWLRGAADATAALPELLEAVRDADAKVRAAAVWAMGRTGAAGVLAPLGAALGDASESVRMEAALALGVMGPAARAALPALWGALSDERQAVRWAAARALAASKPAPDSVPELIGALRSHDPFVRGFAAFSLGNLGPAASEAVPALVEALAAEDGYDRGGAAMALARMGPAAEAAVPALVEGLASADGDRRWKAARTLGRIGPAARAAAPALVRALRDDHEFVRGQAARALGRIGAADAETRAALKRARRDREPGVRRAAEQALKALAR